MKKEVVVYLVFKSGFSRFVEKVFSSYGLASQYIDKNKNLAYENPYMIEKWEVVSLINQDYQEKVWIVFDRSGDVVEVCACFEDAECTIETLEEEMIFDEYETFNTIKEFTVSIQQVEPKINKGGFKFV